MFYEEVPEGPPDPIFGLSDAFNADVRVNKVNLVIGIYKNERLESELLSTVRAAKQAILEEDGAADYLPIDGSKAFLEQVGGLLFGEALWGASKGRIYAAQTVGGTSALRIGAEFCSAFVGKKFAVSNPTWPNHRQVFEKTGVVETYSYYSQRERRFDLSAMLSGLKALEPKTVVLLQGACHNPTGCDPTADEWAEIAKTMRERQLMPFFDVAYQGFGRGIEEDAAQVRHFTKEGLECLVAYSCSKNFSLYCQRVGVLFAVAPDAAVKQRVGSQIKRVIRTSYSNPPAHGARIVQHILGGPMRRDWRREVDAMRGRISEMRNELVRKLALRCRGKNFDYLLPHQGMFSFIDLEKRQVARLIEEFGIYLPDSGRINVAGLNSKNIDDVVEGLGSVLE